MDSIVLPQRKLFTQMEPGPINAVEKEAPRESLAKSQLSTNTAKTYNLSVNNPLQVLTRQPRPTFPPGLLSATPNQTVCDESMEVAPRKLFGQQQITKPDNSGNSKQVKSKPKTLFGKEPRPNVMPVFPAEILSVSVDKTVPNTTKLASEIQPPANKLFKSTGAKRKKMFVDLFVSESEGDLSDAQAKRISLPKRAGSMEPPSRRSSLASRGTRDSLMSTTTDIYLDEWKMLPSSTILSEQLEEMVAETPTKRIRLSKLLEQKAVGSVKNTKLTNKSAISNSE